MGMGDVLYTPFAAIFTVEEGNCQIVANGACVISPGYGEQEEGGKLQFMYPNDEGCRIRMNNNALLVVMQFGLEFGYDYLQASEGFDGGSSVHYSGYTVTEAPTEDVPGWHHANCQDSDCSATNMSPIPEHLFLQSGNLLTFSSDYSVSGIGFKMCTRSAGT